MKHYFIMNPAAGKENYYETIRTALEKVKDRYDYAIYLTQGVGDATRFIRQYCTENPNERVRFYACGGDGTLNEVVNGVVGFANASVGCYPCGSGNDFVKYYGGKRYFFDLDALLNSREEYIDLIRVGDRYAINAAHFGFDSCVAQAMMNVRRKKVIGGKNAYTTGVVVGLLKGMKNPCKVSVDGEPINPRGTILLCTIANGQFVGGSFRCAPRSLDNDGKLEVCLVHPLSRITFMRLVKDYANGRHIGNPKYEKYIEYRRGRRIDVEAPEGFVYSLDGELITENKFRVEVVPHAIRFAVPRGAAPLPGVLHIPKLESEECAQCTTITESAK